MRYTRNLSKRDWNILLIKSRK